MRFPVLLVVVLIEIDPAHIVDVVLGIRDHREASEALAQVVAEDLKVLLVDHQGLPRSLVLPRRAQGAVELPDVQSGVLLHILPDLDFPQAELRERLHPGATGGAVILGLGDE